MKKHKVRDYADRKRPHLKYVVNTKEGGKRSRAFFETKREAETFAQQKDIELLNGGIEAAQFPSALRVMATAADRALSPFGKTIADAVAFYLPHLEAATRSCTMRALTDELLASQKQDGSKTRYVQDLSSRLGQFCATYGDALVSSITAVQVDDWLRGRQVAPTTRNNHRRALIRAFSYAVTRRYCVTNPAKASSKAKETKHAAGILTVQQAADLLTHSDDVILPAVALGLFAGLRPESEGLHLDWSHIDFSDKTINVEPDKTKADSSARYVDMSENLVAWLLPHKKRRGAVFPRLGEYYDRLRAARKAAGITEWPHDALRHSFGSYHYGKHRSAAVTQAQMGHSNAQIFFKHYRKPMKKAAAEKYWQIMPSPSSRGRKIVSIAA